jgi:NhaP-type Na+/H+ or K+/H+ antiporter
VDPVGLFTLGAIVLTVSALGAGLIERAPISFPMIFLGLGLLLGDGVTGAVSVDLEDDALRAVAFATLSLVLFLDAVRLDLGHLRRDWIVPALTLGPGTLLVIALVAVAAMLIAGLEPVPAFLVGAALASTDPVVLRDVLRDRRVPGAVRRALSVEAGTNDLIVLPTVLVLIAVAADRAGSVGGWLGFLVELLFVGPALGAAVGVAGAYLMHFADSRHPVRSEWQALYGIGLVLGAFAVGETVGADGFLASFAAGAAVSASNRTLCDCFLDFGEVISELLMLLSFVLFGVVLSTELGDVAVGEALLLAAVALVAVRPLAITAALSVRRAALSPEAKAFIGWFGPRGLNSLLLALLVVEAGVVGSREVFGLVGLVVLVSVYVHGSTATPLTAWYGGRVDRKTPPEERESTAADLLGPSAEHSPRISVAELAKLLESDEPPVVVDVRSRASYARDPVRIPDAVRVRPDDVAKWGANRARDRLIVLYCT